MFKNILVTGGAGFIGSNLIDKLLSQKYKVISIDNYDNYYQKEIKLLNNKVADTNPDFIKFDLDIRDKQNLQEVFKSHKVDLVLHLAGKAGVRPSILNPNEYFDVNVNGTINLLNIMNEYSVQKIIFASSSSIYGNSSTIPFAEDDIVNTPISPYAASKKAAELILHVYHQLYQMDVICFRFFTVYGPRQRPDLAIFKFFNCLKTNQPIEIYGDGETGRDYTFIDDITDGILGGITFIKNKNNFFEIINLGNNNPVKLNTLIQSIENVTGSCFVKHILPMQLGDVNLTYAKIDKARVLLNYNPSVLLETGLDKFKSWYETNH